MTTPRPQLHSMTFANGEPDTVTVTLPVESLYGLARVLGVIAPRYLSQDFAPHSHEFYDFVTGEVANRFYEDGLTEATDSPFSPEYLLAFLDDRFNLLKASRPESEKDLLRDHIRTTVEAQDADAPADVLVESIALDLEVQGWRMPVSTVRRRH